MSSRLIVRNLPKHLKEIDLLKHFESNPQIKCTVTDAKIMTKNSRSRLFGFVGFKTEEQATAALKYFNNTFLHTSKIQVDLAKGQGDDSLPRPWSKHSMGSSAFERRNPEKSEKDKKRDLKAAKVEVEAKKSRFREFLKLSTKTGAKQSWNDNFESFINDPAPARPVAAEKKEDTPTDEQKQVESEFIDDKRLYVMNLSFTVTKEELQDLFGKYGVIVDIEIPFRKGGRGTPLGIGFVRFAETESAIQAFAELDKHYYQGRKLHIKPAEKKPPKPIEENEFERKPYEPRNEEGATSNYKKEKEMMLKTNFDDETNWNYLYMNQDTVASSMAKQLGIQKGELLDKNSGESMAVKLASSETLIINQTKLWLKEHCNIDFEKVDRKSCVRSQTILLVKNIPATTKEQDLRDIFERYGALTRLLISPFNTLAIVEYGQVSQSEAAMRNLAYYKVNYLTPIYLEYAPIGTLSQAKQVAQDSDSEIEEVKDRQQRQIFVKNLNFNTREEQVETLLKESKIPFKAVKIIRRSDNQLSRGYGFIEVESKEIAEKCVKKLQNFLLDDHAIKLSLSTKAVTAVENEKKKEKVLKKRTHEEAQQDIDDDEILSQKLMVKNLAFECTQEEVREMFKPYGTLKKVRLPKKVNSQNHRGFGFVEFATKEEAKKAFKALQHTHLYNRRLVIEYAKGESLDSAVKE